MGEAGATWPDLERIGAGVGPGSFTGLRIGIATARALGQAHGLALAPVSSLAALAQGAREALGRPVTAVLDARRGEVYALAFDAGGRPLGEAEALAPEALATRLAGALAVGDGSLRFREQLEAAGAEIPAGDSQLHRLSAVHVCRLAAEVEPVAPEGLLPHYVRAPDAEQRRRPTT
jgi:tRNA threonylcarbamoyladenosine biosynthesis protein TsaB